MASPSAQTTTPVDWSLSQVSVSNLTVAVARLKVPLHLGAPPSGPASPHDLCWLPVLLGLEFFLSHQAEFTMLLPPRRGMIVYP